MYRFVVLGAIFVCLGCTQVKEHKARHDVKKNLDALNQALEKAQVRKEVALARITDDPETELFPYAEATIIESVRDDLGEMPDDNGEAGALAVEPLDEDKWEVRGEYHGQDPDGKHFRREWTVEVRLVVDSLETKSVSHSEKIYE